MRTRNQSKQPQENSGNRANISRKAAGRHQKQGSSNYATEDAEEQPNQRSIESDVIHDVVLAGSTVDSAKGRNPSKGEDIARTTIRYNSPGKKEDAYEPDWEDGSISIPDFRHYPNSSEREVTIEFSESPPSGKRRIARRPSVAEKELAELVHKVHLLCLVARGRLIDSACSDPLIQASLVSLLPTHLLKISDDPKLTANMLVPLVNWFHSNFHVHSAADTDRSLKSSLAYALENREGTAEEIAALSVALFRALNLTTRFVSVLDVASLKPDADMTGCSNQDNISVHTEVCSNSTKMVPCMNQVSASVQTSLQKANIKGDIGQELHQRGHEINACNITCKTNQSAELPAGGKLNGKKLDQSGSKDVNNPNASSNTCAEGSKRKGDVEFELQLEMALSATAAEVCESSGGQDPEDPNRSSSCIPSPYKRMKRTKAEESQIFSQGAAWSRKGPPLYWAEVFCTGETFTGRWLHVDAANAVVDGEQKVESAYAACRRSLRYVVAFAGHGAKDVTRRYCVKWYTIASQRISAQWWDRVLAPLKELESSATGGLVLLDVHQEKDSTEVEKVKAADKVSGSLKAVESSLTKEKFLVCVNLAEHHDTAISKQSRSSLEDMELETRALTEPLPTNQQAYKAHHLYAIEKWLTKYQILHPKGPVLGFCSGHPVYPRTCVQMLQTKQKWLQEGLQVKENEYPAKIVKRSLKTSKMQVPEADVLEEDDGEGIIALYGKWQMESLQLPHAVNGIVPKNEHGNVEVWSEKCLPPGTIHLRLPRLVPVVKRLQVDFAPAMVGFEFRQGRSLPVFEGIVVCSEFRDAIMVAYAEEEERREAEEKKRNETQAINRWYQLLSSMATRQRLKNTYENPQSTSEAHHPLNFRDNKIGAEDIGHEDDMRSSGLEQENVQDIGSNSHPLAFNSEHEHVFPIENQNFDEETSVRTKQCPCGFSIQVEEM